MKRRYHIKGVFIHRLTCTSHICYNLTLQRFPFAYFTISCILIRQAALAILRFRKYREFFIKKSKSRNLICISYKGSCWNFDLISSTLSWMNYILGNCDVYMISTLYGNYIFHVSSHRIGKLLSHEITKTDVARAQKRISFRKQFKNNFENNCEISVFSINFFSSTMRIKRKKRKKRETQDRRILLYRVKLMTNIARHSFLCTLNVDKRPEQRVEERRKKEADRCPRDYDDSNR